MLLLAVCYWGCGLSGWSRKWAGAVWLSANERDPAYAPRGNRLGNQIRLEMIRRIRPPRGEENLGTAGSTNIFHPYGIENACRSASPVFVRIDQLRHLLGPALSQKEGYL